MVSGLVLLQAFKKMKELKELLLEETRKLLAGSIGQLGKDFIAIHADVTKIADLEKVFKETSGKIWQNRCDSPLTRVAE